MLVQESWQEVMMGGSSGQEVIWEELSSAEAHELVVQRGIALLPVGSTEQHGPHLPLGTDNFIPAAIARRVSAWTGLPILPLIPYAPCEWHMAFPGTITVESEAFIQYVFQVAKSCGRQGIRHIIAINGHTGGSNAALSIVASKLVEHAEVRLWIADVVAVARESILRTATSAVLGHADEVETSEILAIRSDLVQIPGIEPWEKEPRCEMISKNYRRVGAILGQLSPQDWKSLAPEGFTGDPTQATPDRGEAMLDAASQAIIRFVSEIEADPYLPKDRYSAP